MEISLTILNKIFVKTTDLQKKSLKSWFHEIFLVRENFSFFHTVVWKMQMYSHHFFRNNSLKSTVFMNFFPIRVNFHDFLNLIVKIYDFSVKILNYYIQYLFANKEKKCTNSKISNLFLVRNFLELNLSFCEFQVYKTDKLLISNISNFIHFFEAKISRLVKITPAKPLNSGLFRSL